MDKIRIYIALLFCLTLSFIHPVQAQDMNGSSIVSRTILQSGGTKCLEQHIYENGLGDVVREVQSYSGTSFPDIIINHEYDQYRRRTKTWQPVTSRYNVSQTVATNHLGRVNITSTKYSYTGKPTNISINHNLRASGEKEYYTYTYDEADRLSKVTHKLDNGSEITLRQNSYNGLGQLTGTSNSVFATSYAYDIHSWLKRIYSWNPSTLFEENLKYADSDNPCYNGNISAMTWQNSGSTTQKFDYIYDNASRLVSSSYTSGSNSNRFNTQYSYDCMGNITLLSRNGTGDCPLYHHKEDNVFLDTKTTSDLKVATKPYGRDNFVGFVSSCLCV